jgi:hypothetical protein
MLREGRGEAYSISDMAADGMAVLDAAGSTVPT